MPLHRHHLHTAARPPHVRRKLAAALVFGVNVCHASAYLMGQDIERNLYLGSYMAEQQQQLRCVKSRNCRHRRRCCCCRRRLWHANELSSAAKVKEPLRQHISDQASSSSGTLRCKRLFLILLMIFLDIEPLIVFSAAARYFGLARCCACACALRNTTSHACQQISTPYVILLL